MNLVELIVVFCIISVTVSGWLVMNQMDDVKDLLIEILRELKR